MRNIIILLLLTFITMSASAQGKRTVYVWQNGKYTAMENADSITFSLPGDDKPVGTIVGIWVKVPESSHVALRIDADGKAYYKDGYTTTAEMLKWDDPVSIVWSVAGSTLTFDATESDEDEVAKWTEKATFAISADKNTLTLTFLSSSDGEGEDLLQSGEYRRYR